MPVGKVDVESYKRKTKSGKIVDVERYDSTRNLADEVIAADPERPPMVGKPGQFPMGRSIPYVDSIKPPDQKKLSKVTETAKQKLEKDQAQLDKANAKQTKLDIKQVKTEHPDVKIERPSTPETQAAVARLQEAGHQLKKVVAKKVAPAKKTAPAKKAVAKKAAPAKKAVKKAVTKKAPARPAGPAVKAVAKKVTAKKAIKKTATKAPAKKTVVKKVAKPVRGANKNYAKEGGDARTANTAPRITKFVNEVTGAPMPQTEAGDTFEQMFISHGKKLVEDKYGKFELVAGAGRGSDRTTPLDLRTQTHGGELKTISVNSSNQKTSLSAHALQRKLEAVKTEKLKPLLLVQVVDQDNHKISLHGMEMFGSKAISTMHHFGTFEYTQDDFIAAQKASGHYEKAEARAKAAGVEPKKPVIAANVFDSTPLSPEIPGDIDTSGVDETSSPLAKADPAVPTPNGPEDMHQLEPGDEFFADKLDPNKAKFRRGLVIRKDGTAEWAKADGTFQPAPGWDAETAKYSGMQKETGKLSIPDFIHSLSTKEQETVFEKKVDKRPDHLAEPTKYVPHMTKGSRKADGVTLFGSKIEDGPDNQAARKSLMRFFESAKDDSSVKLGLDARAGVGQMKEWKAQRDEMDPKPTVKLYRAQVKDDGRVLSSWSATPEEAKWWAESYGYDVEGLHILERDVPQRDVVATAVHDKDFAESFKGTLREFVVYNPSPEEKKSEVAPAPKATTLREQAAADHLGGLKYPAYDDAGFGPQALDDYQAQDYSDINGGLRHGPLSPASKKQVAAIDKLIAMTPPTEADITVYKGVKGNWTKDLEVGSTVEDKGFLSTSLRPDVAMRFAAPTTSFKEKTTVFEVKVPKGTHFAPSQVNMEDGYTTSSGKQWMDNEAEFLMPRGQKLKITAIEEREISSTGEYGTAKYKARVVSAEIAPVGKPAPKPRPVAKHGDTSVVGGVAPEEKEAIADYALTGFVFMNKMLRGQKSYTMDDEMAARYKQSTTLLKGLIDRSTVDHDVKVYRGAPHEAMGDLSIGAVIEDKGFTSVSKHDEVAMDFGKGEEAIFEFTLPKGTKAADVTGIMGYLEDEDEGELILAPGSRFKVVSKNNFRIQLELTKEAPGAPSKQSTSQEAGTQAGPDQGGKAAGTPHVEAGAGGGNASVKHEVSGEEIAVPEGGELRRHKASKTSYITLDKSGKVTSFIDKNGKVKNPPANIEKYKDSNYAAVGKGSTSTVPTKPPTPPETVPKAQVSAPKVLTLDEKIAAAEQDVEKLKKALLSKKVKYNTYQVAVDKLANLKAQKPVALDKPEPKATEGIKHPTSGVTITAPAGGEVRKHKTANAYITLDAQGNVTSFIGSNGKATKPPAHAVKAKDTNYAKVSGATFSPAQKLTKPKPSPDAGLGIDSSTRSTTPLKEALLKKLTTPASTKFTPEEQQAVTEYMGLAFGYMNDHLRTGTQASEKVKKNVATLKNLIDHSSLDADTTAYRGLSPQDGKLIESLKPGALITDKGFVSMDMDSSVAAGHGGKGGAVLEVKLLKGAKALKVHDALGELVLPPGTSLKVTSVSTDADGVKQVKAELVTEPPYTPTTPSELRAAKAGLRPATRAQLEANAPKGFNFDARQKFTAEWSKKLFADESASESARTYVTSAIISLYDRIPQIKNKPNPGISFDIPPTHVHANGTYDFQSNELALSPKLKDKPWRHARGNAQMGMDWQVPQDRFNMQGYVATHELGHYLDKHVLNTPTNKALSLETDVSPERKRIFEELADILGEKPHYGTDDPWGEERTPFQEKLQDALSRYGTTLPTETIAELWAEYVGTDKPRPVALRAGRLIELAGQGEDITKIPVNDPRLSVRTDPRYVEISSQSADALDKAKEALK